MSSTRLMLVGDLMLGDPEPYSYFVPAQDVLNAADLCIGHVEVPHTSRGIEQPSVIPEQPNPPERLQALRQAGFGIATLAGNHIFDSGVAGIVDTRAMLADLGIVTTGAGLDLNEARRPAVVTTTTGLRVGVLSYNCVGPQSSWASASKAGASYVHIIDHYEVDYPAPGGPPKIYTAATPDTLEALQLDVEALRSEVDVVIVALHKGIGHVPASVAMYESQVGRAAIRAGADAVVGHHAHILKGIEMFRGKAIYHGLGNFVTLTDSLGIENNPSPERLAWAKRRRALFGFTPDPLMPNYPFHPESRNTMIAVLDVMESGDVIAGLIPCYIDEHARPVPCVQDANGESVLGYIERITEAVGFTTRFEWSDSNVVRVSG